MKGRRPSHRRQLIPPLLTGLRVKVLAHSDPSLEGLEGWVVVEEARSLRILTLEGRVSTVLKDLAVIEVEAPGGEYIRISGRVLIGNPLDRVKEYRWRVSRRCRSSSRLKT
ncbi:ribonuclease P protein component 1 [Aeropyrum pernix K1]|uniref:Ribonuclease P protein component 1 n=1 Tax=Aeropyrum pernix (strain ATCC 700893 / DSM 11879 / JCM 9820 / NBRC 100138 / K1) TaxID=272557 RepID=RNP1_AERPE|nr:ribonuclease P protein component 1 [Aeropyrum pernix]Q9YF79.1 RecName: Full=Ribonuclease P protein component 1; Short=RNase P component 1; AltName: Full=Rpp29 [Aeropyrum pernix K1]BAA79317.1 ribonuclease P protein component 1 [Aeropyrum pernix K1]